MATRTAPPGCHRNDECCPVCEVHAGLRCFSGLFALPGVEYVYLPRESDRSGCGLAATCCDSAACLWRSWRTTPTSVHSPAWRLRGYQAGTRARGKVRNMCTSSLANSSREGPDAVFGDELLRADLLICSWERCESCLFSRCFRRGLRGSLATGLGVTVAAVLGGRFSKGSTDKGLSAASRPLVPSRRTNKLLSSHRRVRAYSESGPTLMSAQHLPVVAGRLPEMARVA